MSYQTLESNVLSNANFYENRKEKKVMKSLMKIRKIGMLFLIISLPVFVSMYGCGGGGGDGTTSGATNPYIGFTTEDFSGKSLYLVDEAGYSKATFHQDGRLQAYEPNQNDWYQEGIWSVTDGKLVVARIASQDKKTIYTLINDDTAERYFKVSRFNFDGEVEIAGMFYDQITGLSQAQDFVANHRQP